MRVYSPYQDYYEVVSPNAHEATYVRSYYGPPYAGKSPFGPLSRTSPTFLVTTNIPRQDPPQGPPHPEARNSSGSEPHPTPELASSLQAGSGCRLTRS